MKVKLIAISLTLFFGSNLVCTLCYGNSLDDQIHIRDVDQIYSDADEQIILNDLVQRIDSSFKIPIYIVFTQNSEITTENSFTLLSLAGISFSNQNSLTLFVNPLDKKSRIVFRHTDVPIDKSVISFVNRQFLTANFSGEHVMPLTQAIPLAILEVQNIQKSKKQKLIRQKKEALVEESFSTRFYIFFSFLLFVTAIYGFQFLLKQYQAAEKFEKNEFSTYSRLPTRFVSFSIYILIGPLIIFLYNYVYFYDEWIYSSVAALAASVPLTHFFLYFGLVTKDSIKLWRGESKKTETDLPLIPSLLLLDTTITATKLMEMTFHGLVIKGQLQVHYEVKNFPDGRIKKYLNVEKGDSFDLSKAEKYELPFLEPVQYLEKEHGYYLTQYLGLVKGNLRGLKFFKKDLVSIGLINRGLLSNPNWVVNRFQLSRKGLAWKKNLEKVYLSINNQIIDRNKDAAQTLKFFKRFSDKLLLVNNSIDLLYNNLSSEVRLELVKTKHAGINYLLSDDFEKDNFSRTLKNCFKKKIYTYDEDNY